MTPRVATTGIFLNGTLVGLWVAQIGPAADVVSLPWALSVLVLGAVAVGCVARRAAGGGAMDAQQPPAGRREAVVAP